MTTHEELESFKTLRDIGMLDLIKKELGECRDYIFTYYHNGIRMHPHDHLFAIRDWCEVKFNGCSEREAAEKYSKDYATDPETQKPLNFCSDIMFDFPWSSDIDPLDGTFDSYVDGFLAGIDSVGH